MSGSYRDSYDPFKDMDAYYEADDPSEEVQFRFVEAMEFLIERSYDEVNKIAFCFNLAMYYRDIREFQLEKKYLEKGAEYGDALCKEQLGFIWYYGLCGEQDYEKAFRYFSECRTRSNLYMLADMYRLGQYVEKDLNKSRQIIEKLLMSLYSERKDPRFFISTCFPEVALRLAQLDLDLDEGVTGEFDLDCLTDARKILAVRQQDSPFWGNIKTMHSIIECMEVISGAGYVCNDIYDLLTLDTRKCAVTFDYDGSQHGLEIFPDQGETVYQYGRKWFHGAEDFLEKARIDRKRITTVYDLIKNIRIYDTE